MAFRLKNQHSIFFIKTQYLLFSLILSTIPILILVFFLKSKIFGLVDDAYIPMVYARNIVRGYGIVFEPGGERVEGFTSPLWTAVLTLTAWLGWSLPTVAYRLGVCGGAAALLLVPWLYRLAFYKNESVDDHSFSLWPYLAGLAVVADVGFTAWASSGLETAAYSAGFTLLMLFSLQKSDEKGLGILLWLLTLLRPEAVLLLFPIIIITWRLQESKPLSRILKLIAFFVIPYFLVILFRLGYFGVPFPNSFYAKHDFGGWALIQRGLAYVFTFFQPRLIFGFILLGFLLESPPQRKSGGAIGFFLLIQMLTAVLEGGDHYPLHRFLIPAVPGLSILMVRGMELVYERMLAEKLTYMKKLFRVGIPSGVIGGVVTLFFFHGQQLYEYKANDRYHFSNGAKWYLSEVSWAKNWALVGKWLKEKYPPNTLIAVITAGAIPYYSELRCVDMVGINNTMIAHTPVCGLTRQYPGHEKSNPDYVLSRRPVMMQLFPLLFFASTPYPENRIEEMITYPAQRDLWNHPQFREQYRYTTETTKYGAISYYERFDRP